MKTDSAYIKSRSTKLIKEFMAAIKTKTQRSKQTKKQTKKSDLNHMCHQQDSRRRELNSHTANICVLRPLLLFNSCSAISYDSHRLAQSIFNALRTLHRAQLISHIVNELQ